MRQGHGLVRCYLASVLVFLAGCVLVRESAAQDPSGYPQTLSLYVKKRLEAYQNLPFPLAFLITKDGGYAVAWRCQGPTCNAPATHYLEQAQASCRTFGHLGDCLVHSIGREQVWPQAYHFEEAVRSRLVEPFRLVRRGPAQAQGVVLYVPGHNGNRYPPSLTYSLVPPYLRLFHATGYDVLRYNIAYYDYSIVNEEEIDQAIRQAIVTLREQGYRKVVLAGQSRGAWHILRAAREALPIEAAIVAVPAAHGQVEEWDGQLNKRFSRNNADFEKIIAALADVRILFLFFAGDTYDAGGKVGLVQQHLGARLGRDMVVINAPQELRGHGAAEKQAFTAAYGDCVVQFAGGAPIELPTCRRALDLTQPGLMATEAHVQAGGGQRLTADALRAYVVGQAFVSSETNKAWFGYYFADAGTVLHWFPGDYLLGNTLQASWAVEGDKLCLIGSLRHNAQRSCYALYVMPNGRPAWVDIEGAASLFSRFAYESPAGFDFTPGNWRPPVVGQ